MATRKASGAFLSLFILLGFLVLSLFSRHAEGAIFRVTQNGAGLRDGSSWTNACDAGRFPQLLSGATPGTEIWIAEGRYRPGSPNRPYSAFILPPGVSLYGGFAGNEVSVEQRDPLAHVSVLTGDLSLDDTVNSHGVTERVEDIVGQNSYTVIRCEGEPREGDVSIPAPERPQSVIDGLVITGGNSEVICYASLHGESPIKAEDPVIQTGGLHIENARVEVRQTTFSGNQGFRGGAVWNASGVTRIQKCTFSANRAIMSGGSIYIWTNVGGTGVAAESEMTITESLFSSNNARDDGGAIDNHFSEVSVRRCTFSENTAGNGGGIRNYQGKMTVEACTFSGNAAVGDFYRSDIRGGGIYNQGSNTDAVIVNCTFYGNSADFGGGAANWGKMLLINSTLSENSAAHGEELADGKDYLTEVVNCILWHGYPGDEIYTDQSYPVDVRYSIIKGGYPGEGNLDVSPLLGTPSWNGGPTRTCALLPGSPAIDSGTSSGAPVTDQRGIQRPQKSGFDRGAYEVSVRKFLVMRAPFPGVFRFSTATEQFESGEGTAWGFPEGIPVTVTFLPQAGKRLKDVLVDRRSVGAVSSYTFPNLDRDHEIEAVFMETPSSSGGGGCSAGSGFFSFLLLIPLLLIGRRR